MHLLISRSDCDSGVCLHLSAELLNSFLKKGRRATVSNIPTFTHRKRTECTAPSLSCKTPGYCQFVSKWEIPQVSCPQGATVLTPCLNQQQACKKKSKQADSSARTTDKLLCQRRKSKETKTATTFIFFIHCFQIRKSTLKRSRARTHLHCF